MRILFLSKDNNPSNDPSVCFGSAQQPAKMPTALKRLERETVSFPDRDVNALVSIRKTLGRLAQPSRERNGSWSKEIIQIVEESKYDLLILTKNDFADLPKVHRKSQLMRIAEGVPCSILILKGPVQPIRRILLCDSGAGHLANLSLFTEKMRDLFSGQEEITVLHVMSQISAGPGVPGGQLRAEAVDLMDEHSPEGDWLWQDMQSLEKSGFRPVPKIRHGLVLEEILDEAQQGDYDLIAIGAHRQDGLQGYLLDNLAGKLIAKLDQSVLVLK